MKKPQDKAKPVEPTALCDPETKPSPTSGLDFLAQRLYRGLGVPEKFFGGRYATTPETVATEERRSARWERLVAAVLRRLWGPR